MSTRHGEGGRNTRTRLYGVWATMLSRCRNPKSTSYKYYGAKGVKVCKDWEEYPVFQKWAIDYREGLEIDRINVGGNYCPENCRWVPRLNNRNKTTDRLVTAFGETKSLIEWSEDTRCLVKYHTLKKRLYKGLPPELALMTQPIHVGKYNRQKHLRYTAISPGP